MKKYLLAITAMLVLFLPVACSLNRQTPKSMDNSATELEIRKNLAEDGITGLEIKVNDGTVTLDGHADNSSEENVLRRETKSDLNSYGAATFPSVRGTGR